MPKTYPISFAHLLPREISYLHPDFWDGNTVGHGNIEPASSVLVSPLLVARAVGILARREQLTSSAYPLQTFRPGDVFDAGSHPPGTIVQVEQQRLITTVAYRPFLDSDIEAFAEHPLPMPVSVRDGLGNHALATSHFGYIHELSPGVVMRTWRRQPALVQMVTSVRMGAELSLKSEPIPPIKEVGKVRHYLNSRTGREVLERVRSVEVLGYGEPVQRKQTVIPLSPNALRPQTAE